MKNIHLIQTDKPSRLYLDRGKLWIDNLVYGSNNQNIYITSDEEIKEGDWFIWKDTEEPYIFKCIGLTDTDSLQVENSLTRKIGTFHRNPKDSDYGDWYRCYSKKIILTTDGDLIKEGVQSIDDEFLEWFVKNPSCEEVKTYYIPNEFRYEIIIPKEEPKQETLEEAAEKYNSQFIGQNEFAIEDFINGVKWQQEHYGLMEIELRHIKTLLSSCEKALEDRDKQQKQYENKYSEEEVFKLLCRMPNFFNMTIPQQIRARKEWFEKSKK